MSRKLLHCPPRRACHVPPRMSATSLRPTHLRLPDTCLEPTRLMPATCHVQDEPLLQLKAAGGAGGAAAAASTRRILLRPEVRT